MKHIYQNYQQQIDSEDFISHQRESTIDHLVHDLHYRDLLPPEREPELAFDLAKIKVANRKGG